MSDSNKDLFQSFGEKFKNAVASLLLPFMKKAPALVNTVLGDLGRIEYFPYKEERLIPIKTSKDFTHQAIVYGDGIASLYYRIAEAYDFAPFRGKAEITNSVARDSSSEELVRRCRFRAGHIFRKIDRRPKTDNSEITFGIFFQTKFNILAMAKPAHKPALIHSADITVPAVIDYSFRPLLDIKWQGEASVKPDSYIKQDLYRFESIAPTIYEDKMFVVSYTNGERSIQLYV